MATASRLRRILDRKQWEPCTPVPVIPGAGSCVASSGLWDQYQYLLATSAAVYCYDPAEDAWQLLPSPALPVAVAAGASMARHPMGPSGAATGGTTTTIITTLNLQRDLRGYTVRITAGPNAGAEAVIASNTVGANSVITVTAPFATAITAASSFVLITGRVYVGGNGSIAAGSFKVYDVATNTWTSLAVMPIAFGTDAKMTATPSQFQTFATGTASAGAASTLTNGTKTWGVNQWTNYQIRITAGTGAGQVRQIASNTATVITVSTAWTTAPDATSQYKIEGNDDYIYLLGNNAVAMYRYSISANTWTTLAPVAARTGAPIAGMSGNWVADVPDADWQNESSIKNGRYIYSFRGNGSAIVDRYDIVNNTWESDIAYAPKSELLSTAQQYVCADGYLYIHIGNTGRWMKFNIAQYRMEPWSYLWYAQGAATLGDRAFDCVYTDGVTKLRFVYMVVNGATNLMRSLVF